MRQVIKFEADDGTLFETERKCLEHENPNKFWCVACKGTGRTIKKKNVYPSGLPDSGWAEDWKDVDVGACKHCKGTKMTDHQLVPVEKVVGYK